MVASVVRSGDRRDAGIPRVPAGRRVHGGRHRIYRRVADPHRRAWPSGLRGAGLSGVDPGPPNPSRMHLVLAA